MKKRITSTPPRHGLPAQAGNNNSRLPTQGTHDVTALYGQAVALHQLGRLGEARILYERILAVNDAHIDALNNLGMLHLQNNHLPEGIRLIGKSLAINPNQPFMRMNLGTALHKSERLDEALSSYDCVIALKPDLAQAYFNRGNVLNDLDRPEEALASYDRAIAYKPDYAQAFFNRGNTLKLLGRLDSALSSYDRAIALMPGYAEAYCNRGHVLNDLKRIDEALVSCDRVIALWPDYPVAHFNRGNALLEIGRLNEAVASFDQAIVLKPDYPEAFSNRGNALHKLKRSDEALASYDQAIALRPDYADAYNNRGNVLQDRNRYAEALESYEQAISIKHDLPYALGSWLHCKMHCCNWENIDADYYRVVEALDRGERVSTPFFMLAIPSTPEQQWHCARIYVEDKYPFKTGSLWRNQPYAHDRIRIGYFSSDFRNHAMASLIVGMIEHHDRSRFEITAFSFSPSSDAPIRKRLEKAFDHFVDVSARTDQEVIALARQLEMDIAIDLNGFTANSRPEIFASRVAPIQVNHLGYPGTMGAEYMDYIIADKVVLPQEHQPYYTEKIIHLPDTYWFNDSAKVISDRHFSRAELGLPEDAFVFCCFNNSYKITPDLFDIWMRLLKEVNGSVLWLLEGNAAAAGNLRLEAGRRGISPERLVFAPRMGMAEHLARHRQADLFLDTFYYNAHTTASDALWAGLPVLTRLGDAFAGRVAASLLNAVGMPEMITHSHADYESLALELATQRERLALIKQKLAEHRSSMPLFDTARFTLCIEEAYRRIYERHVAGLQPDCIVVE